MGHLVVFNNISLDGYICDTNGDMSWAHSSDLEWNEFVSGNARGGGTLVFGRVTYDMMASYWPTPMAAQSMPEVAERMNALPKVVFSRTMEKAAWQNTRLVKSDIVAEVRRMKKDGAEMAIMGSGSIVAQLAPEAVIDEYQVVVHPVVLGSGKTMFQGLRRTLRLKLKSTRTFKNGNVSLVYVPAS